MGVSGRLYPMGTGVGVASLGSFLSRISGAYRHAGKRTECRSAVKSGVGDRGDRLGIENMSTSIKNGITETKNGS